MTHRKCDVSLHYNVPMHKEAARAVPMYTLVSVLHLSGPNAHNISGSPPPNCTKI